MNKLVNYVALFAPVFVGIIIMSSLAYSGMNCPTKQITEESPVLYCFYTTGQNIEIINPKVTADSGLYFSLLTDSKVGYANTNYLIKVNFDVYASKPGMHKVTVTQGFVKSNVNLEVVKSDEIKYNVNVVYPLENTNQKVWITLTLTNKSDKSLPVTIKAGDLPSEIEASIKKKTILVDAKKDKKVYFSLEYDEPISSTINYTLSYNKKIQTIPIVLEKEKMPLVIKTNKITALFSLAKDSVKGASDTKIIVIDVLLFVLIVVLFTMFIGRLGKYIVKNKIQNNGGRK